MRQCVSTKRFGLLLKEPKERGLPEAACEERARGGARHAVFRAEFPQIDTEEIGDFLRSVLLDALFRRIRETFLVGVCGKGLAIDDIGENAVLASMRAIIVDLARRPLRGGGVRRADDDDGG